MSRESGINCDLTPMLKADKSKDKATSGDELIVDDKPVAGSFEWPIFKDRTYGKFLKHFMFSFKNIYS